MATFTKQLLSGSTNGRPIKVAATSIGSGTTIHTALTGTSGRDLVFLFVTNTHTSPVTLTIGFGGTTDPDDLIVKAISIPPGADCPPIPIVTGQPLNNALLVRAAASSANLLLISGWVDRVE